MIKLSKYTRRKLLGTLKYQHVPIKVYTQPLKGQTGGYTQLIFDDKTKRLKKSPIIVLDSKVDAPTKDLFLQHELVHAMNAIDNKWSSKNKKWGAPLEEYRANRASFGIFKSLKNAFNQTILHKPAITGNVVVKPVFKDFILGKEK